MKTVLFVSVLGLFISYHGVLSQCAIGAKTCDECISSSFNCSWCTKQNFTSERCQFQSKLIENGCEEAYIESPGTSHIVHVKNEEVTNQQGDKDAIQIMPQKMKITTRKGASNKFDLTFRAANNYPVDLYFLFDGSVSMNKERAKLLSLSDDIGRAIGNISTNYQMGYGTFQDKVVLPFTDVHPAKLENPCKDNNVICVPPFEFKHLLDMTNNISLFKKMLNESKPTGNIDHPEGSGDALIQSIKCKEEIGWRPIGRKLLIFASDDRFHIAGDGKIAGIVTPNDGQCHLDQNGTYAKELDMDYPSVSQLTAVAENNEVHIIFAVTQAQINLYNQLQQRIPNSIASSLDDKDGNIKDIIAAKYKEMVSEVKIVHEEVDGVEVKITAKSDICKQKGTNECQGLEIGKKIEFDVDIIATKCPSKPEDRKKTITIFPSSLKNDNLTVELNIICDCNCTEKDSQPEKGSDICTEGQGMLVCGVCKCFNNRFGQWCECDETKLDFNSGNCQKGNDTEVCSGNGACHCGLCECEKGFRGTYCECDDKNCPSYKRELCGGPTRGTCMCGECKCNPGYEGTSCECPTSNNTCINPEMPDKVCSDAGDCSCGECQCNKAGYVGKYCHICILCGDNICDIQEYRDCAECSLEDAEIDCPSTCPPVQLVDSLYADESCSIKQSDGCLLHFQVVQEDENIYIQVQRTTTCPEPVNILPIVLGVVGGMVLVGLFILIVWKILTFCIDKIEYSKFEEDLKSCRWAQEENPFYRGATTTYKNPMLDANAADGDGKPID